MYSDWRSYHYSLGLERIACDLEDDTTINENDLSFALCHFITEVKKMNGTDFLGKTLYDIPICVQFHLKTLGYSWKLLNSEGFKDVKFTLDNIMKKGTASGIGISIKKANILSSTDEDYLWSLDFLGTHSPENTT